MVGQERRTRSYILTAVGIVIAACGDDALNALVKALDFCRDALNDQRCEVDD